MKSKYYLISDGETETREYYVERLSETAVVVTRPDGTMIELDVRSFNNVVSMLTPAHRSLDIHVTPEKDDHYRATANNHTYCFTVLNERKMRLEDSSSSNKGGGPELKCPMAGKVVLVKVRLGDNVETDDVVVVVEAMKMENNLQAHISGKVNKIFVKPGDTVEIGDPLISIDSPDLES